MLHVVQEQIHIRENLQKVLRGGEARRIQADVDAAALQPLHKVQRKRKLAHGLSAGDGDPSVVREERDVLHQPVIDFIHGGVPSGNVQRLRDADLRALQTADASGTVDRCFCHHFLGAHAFAGLSPGDSAL